ncbi:putative inositol polyphosphate multikinase [Calycina marina]|uniref:Kinase n=1 Tax=Calycina marina TaxID=1763456 RepID=A0A9P8CGE8_9HELO|nr:putative inositol polyphosphate multikinase [Calycina marina]
MTKTLPTHAELVEYKHAVAGHNGTLCDVDGTLFIKPCVQAEVDFYQTSVTHHQDFYEFMPTFLGVLSLDSKLANASIEEQTDALLAKHTHGISPVEHAPLPIAKRAVPEPVVPGHGPRKIPTTQAVVLENAASGFVKPNILDVKLGIRLYADYATPEKKARLDKVTEETIHKTLGFRIAGMRVWQGEGANGEDIDEDGYKVYDSKFGRYSVTEDNVHDAFESFIFSKAAGIDKELGMLVCQAFLTDCERIKAVMEAQESRMFSASLLFVFEGDGIALRKAMEEASVSAPKISGNGNGGAISDEDEDEAIDPKVYAVHIIDFAHAFWTPGKGPDENSLHGIRSLEQILRKLSEGQGSTK